MWQRRPSVSGSSPEATTRARRSGSQAPGLRFMVSIIGVLLAVPCLVCVGLLSFPPNKQEASPSPGDRSLQSLLLWPNLFFWNLKQTTKTLAKEGAAVARINPDRVDALFDPLEPLTEALGITEDVTVFNAAWEGFWMRSARTCLADNAARLEEAVESPACDVVLLVAGFTYDLEQQIEVFTPTTIMGSPAERPIINAAEAERAFLVHTGASLDLRHLLFYEGDGDVFRDEFRTRFGGVVYLYRGATLFAFDCLFTIQPVRESVINDIPEAIFGGDILMEGGAMTIVGCSFFAVVPGFINSISTEIGGSILILSGTATFTLVNFMTSQIFAFNVGVGMHLAVLGGAVSMQGCTHTANLVFAGQGLCGRNIFIGGGVGVFTGIAVTDTMAFLAFYGAGLSIFIGGGLGVFTGCEITLINAISHKAGVGVAVAVGAGMGLFYGVPFAKNLGITLFNTMGVFVYCGAGRVAFVGCPFAHQNAIASWQLLGGAVALGAGQAVFVGCAWARSLGIDFFVGLGGDLFLGAGQMVLVGSTFTSNTGITAYIGQGTEVFVAAGSAFIKEVAFSVNSGVHYSSPEAVAFYVAGRECEVLTFKSPEDAVWFKERGYGVCEKGEGGEEVGGESVDVVVQSLEGRQRLGGWRGLTPLDTSPPALYLGANLSSCTLCGLDNVAMTGPGAEAGETCTASPEAGAACPAPKTTAKPKATALSIDTLKVLPAAPPTTQRKLFGLGRSLRTLVTGEATQEDVGAFDPDASLPDTYVVVANLLLNCSSSACDTSAGELQDVLEGLWLAGVEDETRLLVTPFKDPGSLLETMGIPSFSNDSSTTTATTASTSSSPCAVQHVFAAYAHTTDKATYDTLKARLLADHHTTVSSLAAAFLTPPLCAVNLTLQDSFYVQAPVKAATAGSSSSINSLMGATDFATPRGAMLPRVWINITAPLIAAGTTYEVAISHFAAGDRVGLQVLSSPPRASDDKVADPLFFSAAPRLLHTFKPFDAAMGNQTWAWRVSALTFKTMREGPYFLKAFDITDPRRFVLSQAFDLQPADGKPGRTWRRVTSADHILRRLSGVPPLPDKEETRRNTKDPMGKRRGRRNQGTSSKVPETIIPKSSTLDDVGMMNALLDKGQGPMGDVWKALMKLPSAQKALKDTGLVRQLLDRAPVLKEAPAVQGLDADGGKGWKDSVRVQVAVSKAINEFIDMSLSIMKQRPATSDDEAEQWPTKVLESLSPEEETLATRVAQEGDPDAMASLIDSQASQRFAGMTMERLKAAGLGEEFKTLLGSTALFKNVVDDADLWTTLGFDEEAAP